MKKIFRDFLKRVFDIFGASLGLLSFWWLIFIAWLIASIETKGNGFFFQKRVGLHGKHFSVVKIKTMYPDSTGQRATVTVANMKGITPSGCWMRRFKIDELPQLWNVLLGHMSFVGPRPDVPGYADALKGESRNILLLRPGITGPASIKYRDEEKLLSQVSDPKRYNDEIIWPDKVKINLEYFYNHSLILDIYYIYRTIKS